MTWFTFTESASFGKTEYHAVLQQPWFQSPIVNHWLFASLCTEFLSLIWLDGQIEQEPMRTQGAEEQAQSVLSLMLGTPCSTEYMCVCVSKFDGCVIYVTIYILRLHAFFQLKKIPLCIILHLSLPPFKSPPKRWSRTKTITVRFSAPVLSLWWKHYI